MGLIGGELEAPAAATMPGGADLVDPMGPTKQTIAAGIGIILAADGLKGITGPARRAAPEIVAGPYDLEGRITVVVDNTADQRQLWYQSTGTNSLNSGTWFPFEGVVEAPGDLQGWMIKADAPDAIKRAFLRALGRGATEDAKALDASWLLRTA
jgi:hypothetical protein